MADEEKYTGELLRERDADRAERARANREARQESRNPDRAGEQELRVTINAPNTVSVNGKSVAINIAEQAAEALASGENTVVENLGIGDVAVLVDGSNVQAKSLAGHSDGSVIITEDSDTLIFQAMDPGSANSYPVAVNEKPAIAEATDTELTPATTRLRFVGRLLNLSEPDPDVINIEAKLLVDGYPDIYSIVFEGAGQSVAESSGEATVTIPKYPVAINNITPAGGTDTELTSEVDRLKFEGRLFTVTEPTADVVVVKGDLRVGEDGGSENSDIFTILFSGATVSAADGVATVTITAAAVLPISDEGEEITEAVSSLDFVGETIEATAAGSDVTVTMQELDFRWNINGAATLVKVASKIMGSP